MGVETRNMQRIKPKIKENARSLRREMTDAEQLLWRYLRMKQLHGGRFRRQHPCGHYILDFACLEIKLAIELDGGQHSERTNEDAQRTAWLELQGWKVLRFWNNEVLEEIEAVLAVISRGCDPHPNLPPEMGKE